jgi:riboflavin synthase alpha subunit
MAAVVPHTARATNLAAVGLGDKVNIEVDLISKYIERHLNSQVKGLGEDTLSRVGYLPMGWVEN